MCVPLDRSYAGHLVIRYKYRISIIGMSTVFGGTAEAISTLRLASRTLVRAGRCGCLFAAVQQRSNTRRRSERSAAAAGAASRALGGGHPARGAVSGSR